MDQITKLMEECGIDGELGAELVKSIHEHVDAEKKKLQEEAKQKLAAAKKLCVEEVKKEITRLSRGVEVFLESKSKQIERAKTQQMANEESKSASLLESVKAVVEGVDLSKAGDKDGELQAMSRKISMLEHKNKRLFEEAHGLKTKLAETTEIAAQTARQNRLLESRIEKGTKGKKGKKSKNKVVSEDVKKANADAKKKAKGTLNEARARSAKQERKPAASTSDTLSPEAIADAID